MTKLHIYQTILRGLRNCRTANEEGIIDYFADKEIELFAHSITAHFTGDIDDRIQETIDKVFSGVPNKEETLFRILKEYTGKITVGILSANYKNIEELLLHNSFYSLLILKLCYNKLIEEELNEIVKFHKTFSLTAEQLKEEISSSSITNAVTCTTSSVDYIRFSYEYTSLVPTSTTVHYFNHLII